MFSHRLPENLQPNAYAKLLARKRAEGARLLDLTESNPTKVGIPYPEEEILDALSDRRSLLYEPTPRGLLTAREAVAAYYADRGQRVHPDQIVLTASTSEAYSFLFKLLADPGDTMLIPSPSYPLFDLLAGLADVRLVPYPLLYQGHDVGWRVGLEDLAQLAVPSTRGILLVNPNNPTGSCLRASERDWLLDLCASKGMAIVSDEVFSDYVSPVADREVVRTMVSTNDVLCFTLSGLSKVCALPQLKLGWMVVSGPERDRSAAMDRLDLISDTFLSVGAPVQHAASRLLALRRSIQGEIERRVRCNRAILARAVEGHDAAGIGLLRSDGGWYAVLEVPDRVSDEKWALDLLEHDDVVVQPGYFFSFPREAFLVVSLLPSEAVFEEAIHRLVRRVDKT